jgi:response regulator of citrate/malate metabolism
MIESASGIGNVMLIDDSKIDNFVNSKVLELSEKAEIIQVYDNPNLALEYLRNTEIFPDVIFVDIYMPDMSGFEFLDEYCKLPEINKKDIKVILLSSAYDNLEIEKLRKYTWLSGYVVKPLTYETLNSLVQTSI